MADYDVYLLGAVLGGSLGFLTFFTALFDKRFPTIGVFLLAVGGVCGFFAYEIAPDPVTVQDVPEAFIKLAAYLKH